MKAFILSVGTELTTGQILNRNAPWIADKLQVFGITVAEHRSVPDDRALILQSLRSAQEYADILFVTGGLGPTSDDFTSEVIAEWCGVELIEQAAVWEKIRARLQTFGVPVAESNRQQSRFPAGAVVIPNANGTADGFSLIHGKLKVFVFPGPPVELETVWFESTQGPAQWLTLQSVDGPRALKSLGCIGKSEAEIGEIVDRILQPTRLEYGFRAHAPYVEVKIWIPADLSNSERNTLIEVESALAPFVVQKDNQNFAREWIDLVLKRFTEIEIVDHATNGLLMARLEPLLQTLSFEQAGKFRISTQLAEIRRDEPLRPGCLWIGVGPETADGQWKFALKGAGSPPLEVVRTQTLPYPKMARSVRSRKLIVELALKMMIEAIRP